MNYQVSWHFKRTPGPGRRGLVGMERFERFADAAMKAQVLLWEGMEVRILLLKEA